MDKYDAHTWTNKKNYMQTNEKIPRRQIKKFHVVKQKNDTWKKKKKLGKKKQIWHGSGLSKTVPVLVRKRVWFD